MLCEIPWGACPFSRKASQAKRIRAVVPRFSFPVSSVAGYPAVAQLNERRLSPLFCGRRSARWRSARPACPEARWPHARLCCAPLVRLRIRSQIGSHRTAGAAGDDNVWRAPARSGYAVYIERTGPTPDRFMKQFGRGGAGGGYAPSQPVRFNQPAQFKSGLQPPTAEPGASGDLQGRASRTAVSSKSMPRR